MFRIYQYFAAGIVLTAMVGLAQAQATQPKVLKIMPLGDSITAGYASDATGGYRLPLQQKLTAAGISYQFVGSQKTHNPTSPAAAQPDHEGYDGYQLVNAGGYDADGKDSVRNFWNADNTPKLDANGRPLVWSQPNQLYGPVVDTAIKTCKPDVILLMIGTNDLFYPDYLNAKNRGVEYQLLLDQIFATDARVKVIAAPILYKRGSVDKSQIDAVNTVFKSIVKEYADAGKAISWVGDWTGEIGESEAALPDSVHPSPATYETMATWWCKAIRANIAVKRSDRNTNNPWLEIQSASSRIPFAESVGTSSPLMSPRSLHTSSLVVSPAETGKGIHASY